MSGRMAFDYSKLRGRIVEKFGTQKQFGKAMNISEASLTLKLAGTSNFTQGEIFRAMALLDLDGSVIAQYFFTPRV